MKALLILLVVMLVGAAQAQQRWSGQVTDSTGRPIAGVSIKVLGQQGAVRSSRTGHFEIMSTQQKGLLTFTHIGFLPRTIAMDSLPAMPIVLQAATNTIQSVEVVSTGYQQLPKDRATGAYALITAADLQLSRSTNVLDRLEGMAPGLQFDRRSGENKINIRGLSSLSSALQSPLIVVDNFPYAGDINSLNAEDIHAVTLLKDAAAASIWGARAGNGVIVISTKKGRYKGAIQTNITTNYSIADKQNLWYAPKIASPDFIAVERMLYDQGFYDPALASASMRTTVFSPVVSILEQYRLQTITAAEKEERIAALSSIDYRNDLNRYFYRNPTKVQTAINISGGTDNSTFYLSGGYDRNTEKQYQEQMARYTLRSNYGLRLTPALTLTTALTYSKTRNAIPYKVDYPINPTGGKNQLFPYASLVGEQGEALAIPYRYNDSYINGLSAGTDLLDWSYRPYAEAALPPALRDNNILQINIGLQYKVDPHLSIDAYYNREDQRSSYANEQSIASYETRDLINRFSVMTNEKLSYAVPLGAVYDNAYGTLSTQRYRGQLSYARPFAQRFVVNAVAGVECSDQVTTSDGYRLYGFDSNNWSFQQVDYVNKYPSYDDLYSPQRIPSYTDKSKYVNRFVSYYFNGSLYYRDKYMLSASARRDASNVYGVKSNERWNPLWSAGFAWDIGKEGMLKELAWLDMLQLKCTYGYSGNSGGLATALPLFRVSTAPSLYSLLPSALVSRLPNSSLRWEKVRMINYSLTYSTLNHKLGGTIAYYLKSSTDLIATDPLDPTTGFASIQRNVASMHGKGVDIEAYANIAVRKLQWKMTAAFSYNSTLVDSFYGNVAATTSYTADGGRSLNPMEGKPLYPVYSYQSAGLDPETGSPRGYLNGEVSMDYNKLLADSLQHTVFSGVGLYPYYGSFRHDINYRAFALSIHCVYKFAAYFQKESINYTQLFNQWIGNGDFENRWQKPGDENNTRIPAMQYPANASRDLFYAQSEDNILRADNIRINAIRLTYRWTPTTKLCAAIDFSLNINNVGIIWRRNNAGIDPDYRFDPPARYYTVGIRIVR